MRALLLAGLAACGRLDFAALPDADRSPTSCRALPSTCGASKAESCCATGELPGGAFYRSYDVGTDGMFAQKNAPATVSAFALDRYEITVGRFRAFVDAGGGTQLAPPASGWDPSWTVRLPADPTALRARVACMATFQTWSDAPVGNEDRPMNCLDWYESLAFCLWDGGRLPTEAEWNFAAAGGDEQRVLPWTTSTSEIPDPAAASYYTGTDCTGDGMPGCVLDDLIEVGTKPAGDARWGQADLAGNVWEWTLDAYGPYPVPCDDCGATTGSDRVFRGSGFYNQAPRPAYRNHTDPSYLFYDTGARCAR